MEIFCPVDASVHIIHRARLLKIKDTAPVGQLVNKIGKLRYLTGADVVQVMQYACKQTYPEGHYLRRNIHQIVSHSNRVTAAVCLFLGGALNDEIAHKLRWDVSSVPTYLRDTFSEIGAVMQKTIAAVLNSK